jgi:hypothetical protein
VSNKHNLVSITKKDGTTGYKVITGVDHEGYQVTEWVQPVVKFNTLVFPISMFENRQ